MNKPYLNKPAFRRSDPETGLRSVANPSSKRHTYIKKAGVDVGMIFVPNKLDSDKWAVMIYQEGTAPNLIFKFRGDTEEDARKWVRTNWASINEKFQLRKS